MNRIWPRLLWSLVAFASLAGALWLLFFPITDLFAAAEVTGMNAKDWFAAVNTLRGQIGTVVGAGFVGAGLYYTSRKFFLDRDKQYTDRCTAAVDHLGSAEETVRAGGIRALDRILRDSPVDRVRALKTITGFLRGRRFPEEAIPDDVAAAIDALRDRGTSPRRHRSRAARPARRSPRPHRPPRYAAGRSRPDRR